AAEIDELWMTLPLEAAPDREELFTLPRATLLRLQTLNPQIVNLDRPEAKPNGHKPAGLVHLEKQLFRPVRAVIPSPTAEGLSCIEAPGLVGETRMVARQIKMLLLDGVRPDDILVTMRDVVPYADLVREVFPEYGIPVDVEGAEPLARNPAV